MTICSFNRHKVEPRKHLLEIFEVADRSPEGCAARIV
jgi:hypothetical protein